MSYTLGEVRKTVAAALGAVGTGLATLLANEFVASALPPQWIAVAGAFLTVLAVFGIPNSPSPAAVTAAEAVVDSVVEAQQHLPQIAHDVLPPIVSEKIEQALDAAQLVEGIVNRYAKH